MIVHDVEQGSPEWLKVRLGIPTASCFHRIVTPKGKLSEQADDYMGFLVAEWLLGCPLDGVETQWMQRGHDLEPQAVEEYEFQTDRTTEKVGFITTDDGRYGCSPDRLVGDDGLLEIKCPSPQVHAIYMAKRSVNQKYYAQIQGQLLVAGENRLWSDIESYYPGLPSVVIHVERDREYLALLEKGLNKFCDELDATRRDITERYGPPRWMTEPEKERAVDALGISDEDLHAMYPDMDWSK